MAARGENPAVSGQSIVPLAAFCQSSYLKYSHRDKDYAPSSPVARPGHISPGNGSIRDRKAAQILLLAPAAAFSPPILGSGFALFSLLYYITAALEYHCRPGISLPYWKNIATIPEYQITFASIIHLPDTLYDLLLGSREIWLSLPLFSENFCALL